MAKSRLPSLTLLAYVLSALLVLALTIAQPHQQPDLLLNSAEREVASAKIKEKVGLCNLLSEKVECPSLRAI